MGTGKQEKKDRKNCIIKERSKRKIKRQECIYIWEF